MSDRPIHKLNALTGGHFCGAKVTTNTCCATRWKEVTCPGCKAMEAESRAKYKTSPEELARRASDPAFWEEIRGPIIHPRT